MCTVETEKPYILVLLFFLRPALYRGPWINFAQRYVAAEKICFSLSMPWGSAIRGPGLSGRTDCRAFSAAEACSTVWLLEPPWISRQRTVSAVLPNLEAEYPGCWIGQDFSPPRTVATAGEMGGAVP